MNVFATFTCPYMSAKVLDDKRVVKMVLETAQLLSTAIYINDKSYYENTPGLYRPTHLNHPCTIWTAENLDNFNWLLHHFSALLYEYQSRYNGRQHKSGLLNQLFIKYLIDKKYRVTNLIPVNFANCSNQPGQVHEAYRRCLTSKWKKDKKQPTWYQDKNNFPIILTGY